MNAFVFNPTWIIYICVYTCKNKKDWEEVHQTVASLLQEEKERRYLQFSEYYFFVWIFF